MERKINSKYLCCNFYMKSNIFMSDSCLLWSPSQTYTLNSLWTTVLNSMCHYINIPTPKCLCQIAKKPSSISLVPSFLIFTIYWKLFCKLYAPLLLLVTLLVWESHRNCSLSTARIGVKDTYRCLVFIMYMKQHIFIVQVKHPMLCIV